MSSLYSLNTFTESYMTLDNLTKSSDVEKTIFESMVEFDDNMCILELNHTKDYYTSLALSNESVLHEGVIQSILDFIKNVIENIFNFFKAIFAGGGSSGGNEKSNQNIQQKQSEAKKQKEIVTQSLDKYRKNKDKYKKQIQAVDYTYPSEPPKFETIFSNDQLNKLKDINKQAQFIAQHINKDKDATNNIIKNVQEEIDALSGSLKNHNRVTSMEIQKQVDAASFTEAKVQEIISGKKDKLLDINLATCHNELNDFLKDFKALENVVKRLEQNSEFLEPVRKIVYGIAAIQKQMSSIFVEANKQTYAVLLADLKQTVKFMQMIGNNQEPVEETFSFENMDDYFTEEYAKYRYTYYEALKEGIIKETLIINNPDADVVYEMQALNEAIGAKVKNAFNRLYENIKKLIATFMEKLRRNFGTTKHYLDKYKNIILKNKIPDATYSGKDIINGMYNVINFEIPAFNYLSIKDQLTDNVTFHNYLYRQNQSKLQNVRVSLPQVNSADNKEAIGQIAEYYKTLFGCAGDDIQYNNAELQAKLKDLYDFCYDIRKIDRMLNKTLTDIKNMKDKALKQTGQQVATNADAKTAEAEGKAAQNAAAGKENVNASYYFSYINNFNTLLEDIQANTPSSTTSTTTTTTSSNNMTGQVASNTRTIGQQNTNSNGQTTYGTEGQDNAQVDRDCEVYMQVATKVIQAKLTAIEYIRVESMKIFRFMVESSINNRITSNPNTAENSPEMQRTRRPQQV